MTAATSLLDFILNMLKDPQAQAEFRASPEHVLAANGLTGVSAADIHETLPLVTDNRFVELTSSHAPSPSVVLGAGDSGIHAAIQYLHHITRTYRYDDHGAHGHDLGHVNIWAVGDVTQSFDDSHPLPGGSIPGPVAHDPASSAFCHPSHDQGDNLHSFGSGAAMTWANSAGSPATYSGDAASPAAQDDCSHPHDDHVSPVDSYYDRDSYYDHDREHATYDHHQEPHIYLDLH